MGFSNSKTAGGECKRLGTISLTFRRFLPMIPSGRENPSGCLVFAFPPEKPNYPE